MLSKDKKKQIVEDLADKLARQKAAVFFDYTGLKVNDFQELRDKLRESDIDCRVAKKTLIDLALDKAGIKQVRAGEMSGQLALIFGYEDQVMPAKLLYNFSKTNENIKILAGLMQQDYLDETAVISLAKLPSRRELLVGLLGAIKSPLYGLHNSLKYNLFKLLLIFKEMKQETSI